MTDQSADAPYETGPGNRKVARDWCEEAVSERWITRAARASEGDVHLAVPKRFSTQRLQMQPCASMKWLSCVSIPPMVSWYQSWPWGRTDLTT